MFLIQHSGLDDVNTLIKEMREIRDIELVANDKLLVILKDGIRECIQFKYERTSQGIKFKDYFRAVAKDGHWVSPEQNKVVDSKYSKFVGV